MGEGEVREKGWTKRVKIVNQNRECTHLHEASLQYAKSFPQPSKDKE